MVDFPGAVLDTYPRFSRYNSPYPEHDAATAIDLYPDRDDRQAPSPVAGTVTDVRTVRCPSKPYAVDHDHLIVVDTGDHLARILHVDPTVEVGDDIGVGESLGELVRSGFFAPWVANHIHLAFRDHDANPVRATGSLPLSIAPDTTLEPVTWDGTGTVVDAGDTWVVLDAPTHPDPGRCFAGIASDDGSVLDGGLPHYDYGGLHRASTPPTDADTVSLLGTTVGDVLADDRQSDDRQSADQQAPAASGSPESDNQQHDHEQHDHEQHDHEQHDHEQHDHEQHDHEQHDNQRVAWRDVTVTANDVPITGLSLFLGRDWLGAKLVHPDHDWSVGDDIRVDITSA